MYQCWKQGNLSKSVTTPSWSRDMWMYIRIETVKSAALVWIVAVEL